MMWPGASLQVSIGQHSTAGRKALNQDSFGAYLPKEPELSSKGIVLAVADGISTSTVSQIASETAVKVFWMIITAPAMPGLYLMPPCRCSKPATTGCMPKAGMALLAQTRTRVMFVLLVL